jgi:hypothetical protein
MNEDPDIDEDHLREKLLNDFSIQRLIFKPEFHRYFGKIKKALILNPSLY